MNADLNVFETFYPDNCDTVTLTEDDLRRTALPVSRHEIYKLFRTQVYSFWHADEISFEYDKVHYPTLSPPARRMVDTILGMFAKTDDVVQENAETSFIRDIRSLEVRYFYQFQIMMENEHAITYSTAIENIIPPERKREIYEASENVPAIKRITKWTSLSAGTEPLGVRLLRMVCVEGIIFPSCFCPIYWLSSHGKMPGLAQSNEQIARDEGLHTRGGVLFLKEFNLTPPVEVCHKIVAQAVTLANELMAHALSLGDLPGLSYSAMEVYNKLNADNMLTLLGLPVRYRVKQPFSFMENLNLSNRTSFFERRVTEYSFDKVKSEVKVDFDF